MPSVADIDQRRPGVFRNLRTKEPLKPEKISLCAEKLPVEVWERVFDALAENGQLLALLDCALTCRLWAPRCLWHLARHVVVCSRKHGQRVGKAMVTSHRISLATAITFRKPVGFVLGRPITSVETLGIGDYSPSVGDWKAKVFHADVFTHLRITFPSVTRLTLDNTTFPSVVVFARLVFSFPRLTRFACHFVAFATGGYLRGRALPPKGFAMTDVELYQSDDVVDFLVERSAEPLTYEDVRERDRQGASASLRSLDVWSISHRLDSLGGLGCFKYLESLTLAFDAFEQRLDPGTVWDDLYNVLGGLASSKLQQFTISFIADFSDIHGCGISDTLQTLSTGVSDRIFARIDDLLAGPRYHHLQTICFRLWFDHSMDLCIPGSPSKQLWFRFLSCHFPRLSTHESFR
ncbi:uncharacterized protein FIBRA_06446 [Fibroporia radiculosa]|uniref:F-box domain-containing protein n=1 Tax=Fibroporia radiculosa TaxID=599839 RepID=J4GSR5_9APHY|nr:uncharacterized protein FIBRA_06446 [Fibroporia radiculosa]CCM04275.1 predicted protein [Fibroporia radiculosa]